MMMSTNRLHPHRVRVVFGTHHDRIFCMYGVSTRGFAVYDRTKALCLKRLYERLDEDGLKVGEPLLW
jgi:hypothetical protein